MTITRSAAELLAGASSRERVTPADARSGAVFERVVVGPDCYFVKHLGFASDWVMRVTGDDVCRQYLIWQAGIMDRFPDCIDHAVVAMDLAGAGDDAVLTIVMREVGGFLVPPGDAVVPGGQHAAPNREICVPSPHIPAHPTTVRNRRYTGDRKITEPFGPYNARYTGDHRSYFRSDLRR